MVVDGLLDAPRGGSANALVDRERRRIAAMLRPIPKTRGSHHDPLFERPGLIEGDYYRLRHQPRG